MKHFLKKIFLLNWQRKIVAFILSMVIWIIVNNSMTSSKSFIDVPVKVINIPNGKVIEGMQEDSFLNKKISLTLTGNKNALEMLDSTDLEIVIDASNKQNEWIINITKRNLFSLNPNVNIHKDIKKIDHISFVLRLTKLVFEKIPIIVTTPLGDAPKGYQFLDIWPNQLYITVSGAENVINKLKERGLKLTFNLDNINKHDLKLLEKDKSQEEISFFIPTEWKKIRIPYISSEPLSIDDPAATNLRIDFIKNLYLNFGKDIPVSLFFPIDNLNKLNPGLSTIQINEFLTEKDGLFFINKDVYTKGISKSFLDIVKDMVEMKIAMLKDNENNWNIQFICPKILEKKYIQQANVKIDKKTIMPVLQEEYFKNQFKNYMDKFVLYNSSGEKLYFDIKIENNKIIISSNLD